MKIKNLIGRKLSDLSPIEKDFYFKNWTPVILNIKIDHFVQTESYGKL